MEFESLFPPFLCVPLSGRAVNTRHSALLLLLARSRIERAWFYCLLPSPSLFFELTADFPSAIYHLRICCQVGPPVPSVVCVPVLALLPHGIPAVYPLRSPEFPGPPHTSRAIQPTSLQLQLERRLGLPTSWVGVSLFSAANAMQLMWCIFGACGFPNISHGTSLPSWYYFSCGSTSIGVHQILIGYSLSRKGGGKSESEGR